MAKTPSHVSKSHEVQNTSSTFATLLHVSDEQLNIQDPGFYFSSNPTDIEAEIDANIAQLTQPEHAQDYICRFPARAQLLAESYSYIPQPDFSPCGELQTYLDAVSANSISLVYASENLLSPSSFMGHAFIKLSENTQDPGHAVSFFTEVAGFNLPKIMFDSLVVGKEGYFMVSPYRESLEHYKGIEGRNVYEYQLNLSEKDKQLIKLHLWELKDTKIDYYFHNQNCASITLNLIAISNPDLMAHRRDWLSPLDLIQLANQSQMIEQASITPSLNWRLRAYGASQTDAVKQSLVKQLSDGALEKSAIDEDSPVEQQFLTWEFSSALNQYLLETEEISEASYTDNARALARYDDQFESLAVDLSDFKNPLKRQKDAQWQIGTRWDQQNDPELTATWLPASHTLKDDNRNAFSESSLELMKISVSASRNALRLDNFTLYAINSYIPYDPLFGGWSGKFSVQWDRGTDFAERDNKRLFVSGGLGLSHTVNNAVQVYATVDTELSASSDKVWGAFAIDTGLFSYFRQDVKISLSANTVWNQYADSNFKHKASATLTYLGLEDTAIDLGAQYADLAELHETQFNVMFRRYY